MFSGERLTPASADNRMSFRSHKLQAGLSETVRLCLPKRQGHKGKKKKSQGFGGTCLKSQDSGGGGRKTRGSRPALAIQSIGGQPGLPVLKIMTSFQKIENKPPRINVSSILNL